MKLIMTKGLPASGKTTWAKIKVKKSQGTVKRVNKDDLRNMIDAQEWSKTNEKHILRIRDRITEYYLYEGFDVIVDDTNLHPKHKKALKEIADTYKAEFEIKDFSDVPLKTCIKRDCKRDNSVGEKVIRQMHNQFTKKTPESIAYNDDLPDCIIVDIDGTLAHMSGRSPYDYSKVSTDTVDETVRDLLYTIKRDVQDMNETYIIVMSGREGTLQCQKDTGEWLEKHQIPFDELHMRAEGDQRDDRIVKKELYEKWVKDRYNVKFVLDDRDRVVKMWREQGLKVLQVAEGDF